MNEIWKAVVGFEGRYEISDRGRVRSLDRVVSFSYRGKIVHQKRSGQILKSFAQKSGHLHLKLGQDSGQQYVHILVLKAFVGPRPAGLVGCHNDGKTDNNTPRNLRWDTQLSNIADQEKHGTRLRGSSKIESRLNEDKVREIKRLRGRISQAAIAKKFGVGKSTVQAALDGRTWRHVS